jgi:predicted kinase
MLTIVTGPPCSGKTTHVTTHAQPGDITIDYDTLALALGAPASHDYPPHICEVVFAARHSAITAAISQHHQGATVWIIDTAPGEARRQQYADAGAQFVTLTASREELHARAAAERPASIHQVIDDWLDGTASNRHHTPSPPAVTGSRYW